MGDNAEARIVTVAILNTLAYVFNASLPCELHPYAIISSYTVIMYPAKKAPHYRVSRSAGVKDQRADGSMGTKSPPPSGS